MSRSACYGGLHKKTVFFAQFDFACVLWGQGLAARALRSCHWCVHVRVAKILPRFMSRGMRGARSSLSRSAHHPYPKLPQGWGTLQEIAATTGFGTWCDRLRVVLQRRGETNIASRTSRLEEASPYRTRAREAGPCPCWPPLQQ